MCECSKCIQIARCAQKVKIVVVVIADKFTVQITQGGPEVNTCLNYARSDTARCINVFYAYFTPTLLL